MHKNFVIAIDGPAASGKGTVARLLAQHYKFALFPTGNLYRLLAKKIIDNNIDIQNILSLIDLCNNINLDELHLPELHKQNVGIMASKIAQISEVREIFYKIQRSSVEKIDGLIMEGRDIGTVICPEAQVKIFLTASITARAKRRFKDVLSKNSQAKLEDVEKELTDRDFRDQNRPLSPLYPAPDAVILDNSNLNIEQTLIEAIKIINHKN